MAFRGIYGILVAPYKEDLSLDIEDLRSLVEYCVKGGSHGIVVPVNASEFIFLTDEERRRVVEVTVEQTAGRIPVIAGVAAPTALQAAAFARHAKDVGADGVIAMPPYIAKAGRDAILDYYRAIVDASSLPVFLQNYIEPIGTPMSAPQCVDIMREIDGAFYVKEETADSSHMITRLNELASELPAGRYEGVMGGKACRYLLDEYRRGACGCMPACEVVDVQARIWDLLEAGKQQEAEEIFNQVIPLLNMEYMYGYSVYKEVLKRRGVIKCAANRAPGKKGLDAMDRIEFDRVYGIVEPWFRV